MFVFSLLIIPVKGKIILTLVKTNGKTLGLVTGVKAIETGARDGAQL